jgi:hypothetical protein
MDVNETYECSDEGTHTQNIRSSPTRSHASEEENRTRNQQENLQVYYCRFQVTVQHPKFVANLPITFPTSKFENWVRTSQQSSRQVHFNVRTSFLNICSYSIIITNSMKYIPSW